MVVHRLRHRPSIDPTSGVLYYTCWVNAGLAHQTALIRSAEPEVDARFVHQRLTRGRQQLDHVAEAGQRLRMRAGCSCAVLAASSEYTGGVSRDLIDLGAR